MSSTPEGLGSVVRRDHRIDLLRGAAIAVVLILHFHLAYNLVDSSFSTVVRPIFIHALARNGNYGVTVFFVISGFLITSTSVRRFGSLNAISLRSFYTFRFARIYPCLLLELFLITSFGLAGWPYFRSSGHTSFLLADLSVLTFWHNVLMAKAGYFNYGLNVLWSLSVEEVFYLIFPLLCLLLRKEWRIVSVWVLAILYGPFYRSHNAADDIHYLYGYFACFDAVALGCCTAIMARRVRMRNSVILAVQFAAAVFMV